MFQMILCFAITAFLVWLVPAGTRYFEQEERRARAREKAKKQSRWWNGTFAKKRTPTIVWAGRP